MKRFNKNDCFVLLLSFFVKKVAHPQIWSGSHNIAPLKDIEMSAKIVNVTRFIETQNYNEIFLQIFYSFFNAYYFLVSDIRRWENFTSVKYKKSFFQFCHSRFDSLKNLGTVKENYGEK